MWCRAWLGHPQRSGLRTALLFLNHTLHQAKCGMVLCAVCASNSWLHALWTAAVKQQSRSALTCDVALQESHVGGHRLQVGETMPPLLPPPPSLLLTAAAVTPFPCLRTLASLATGATTIAKLINSNNPSFVDFIQRCLVWDSAQRLTPQQALQHAWIANNAPSPLADASASTSTFASASASASASACTFISAYASASASTFISASTSTSASVSAAARAAHASAVAGRAGIGASGGAGATRSSPATVAAAPGGQRGVGVGGGGGGGGGGSGGRGAGGGGTAGHKQGLHQQGGGAAGMVGKAGSRGDAGGASCGARAGATSRSRAAR